MKKLDFIDTDEGSGFDAYRKLVIQDKIDKTQQLFNRAAETILMGRTGEIHVDEVAKKLSCDNGTAFNALFSLFKKGKDITIIND